MFGIIIYSDFICDFPETLAFFYFILLHTMHVTKVQ